MVDPESFIFPADLPIILEQDNNESDVESNVACKAGIPGNINDTDNKDSTDEIKQSDLSSLQHSTQKNKSNDPEVLDMNDAELIDKALGIYYKRMKRNDYYENKNKGKFLKYFQDHDYDIDDIVDELSVLPDDIMNAAKNCSYLDFDMFNDSEFPMDKNKQYKNSNDERIEQFKIVQYCWKFGVPPFRWYAMSKHILLIHGYIKKNCMNKNDYMVYPIIEQNILLFFVYIELHWRLEIGYKQRIRKILDHYSNWDLMETISCIIPSFLWLGDEDHAADIKTLETLGINYILNCAGNDVMAIEYPKHFKIHWLFADDADDYNIILSDISGCIQFISECIENNGKILIHCLAGMNRSATVTVACLMYFKGMNLFAAIKYTQMRRGYILSNESFQRQLVQYAAKLNLLDE